MRPIVSRHAATSHMIRGTAAEYAPGAIGDVGQRLVQQFAGNVEQLLSTQAGDQGAAATPPGWLAAPGRKRAAAVAALLLTAGSLAGLAAWLLWRRRGAPASGGWPGPWAAARPAPASPPPDPAIPRNSSPEGARHG